MSTVLDREIINLESLYVIAVVEEMRKTGESPYSYLDGKEMSTRDVLRIAGMLLRGENKPLKVWNINHRIKILQKKLRLVKKIKSYKGFGNTHRVILGLTPKGEKMLGEGYVKLNKVFGDRLPIVRNFPEELKQRYMPNRFMMETN